MPVQVVLLVVDANTLVGEITRQRGRQLLLDAQLELVIAERPWDEAQHELRKRLDAMQRYGRLSEWATENLLMVTLPHVMSHIRLAPVDEYGHLEAVARARVPRDPDDWPSVALALTLDAGIWTNDRDFFGCGVATWITDTLRAHLAAQPEASPATGREGAEDGHDTEDGGAGGHSGA